MLQGFTIIMQSLELVNHSRTLKNQWVVVSFRVYSFIFGMVDMLIIDIKKSLYGLKKCLKSDLGDLGVKSGLKTLWNSRNITVIIPLG